MVKEYRIAPDDGPTRSIQESLLVQKIITIPKRNGKLRVIYVPTPQYKERLRTMLATLPFFTQKKFSEYAMGFVPGRSIVNNAKKHIDFEFTLSFDLENFFDSVKVDVHLKNKVPEDILQNCLYDNAPRQGLPTSPFLANIAAESLDDSIARICRKYPEEKIIYTRYADDLCFSFNDPRTIQFLMERIPTACSNARFPVNPAKTRLQVASNGRRMITGIAVDSEIHVPRRIKRKIRAAQHQARINEDISPSSSLNLIKESLRALKQSRASLKGLNEFAKLQDPELLRQNPQWVLNRQRKRALSEVKLVLNAYSLAIVANRYTYVKKEIPEIMEPMPSDPDYRFAILNDPVYFVGMSTFTTNWSSCMNLSGTYPYRKGSWLWNNLAGVSLAAVLSPRKMRIGGVERATMNVRTLLYKCKNGLIYHGRIYPDVSGRAPALLEWLKNKFTPTKEWGGHANYGVGQRVLGNTKPALPLPYFDNTRIIQVKIVGKKTTNLGVNLSHGSF